MRREHDRVGPGRLVAAKMRAHARQGDASPGVGDQAPPGSSTRRPASITPVAATPRGISDDEEEGARLEDSGCATEQRPARLDEMRTVSAQSTARISRGTMWSCRPNSDNCGHVADRQAGEAGDFRRNDHALTGQTAAQGNDNRRCVDAEAAAHVCRSIPRRCATIRGAGRTRPPRPPRTTSSAPKPIAASRTTVTSNRGQQDVDIERADDAEGCRSWTSAGRPKTCVIKGVPTSAVWTERTMK